MRISAWSSDVCSSDLRVSVAIARYEINRAPNGQSVLEGAANLEFGRLDLEVIFNENCCKLGHGRRQAIARKSQFRGHLRVTQGRCQLVDARSEERRVGKACVSKR